MPQAATLDRTDLALLAQLQRAGRLTNAELAERVHLSPSACLRRVQRLERDGVIAGYRAEVDAERLGLGLQAFVRVQLARHDPDAVAAFARFVGDWEQPTRPVATGHAKANACVRQPRSGAERAKVRSAEAISAPAARSTPHPR